MKIKAVIRPGYGSLTLEGHAGDDPTCAAVSAVFQTAIIGLESIAKVAPAIEFDLDIDSRQIGQKQQIRITDESGEPVTLHGSRNSNVC